MVRLKPKYRYLYLSAALLAFHYAITVYINSSFLATRFESTTIDHLYMAGAIVTLTCLILSSRFLVWFGNYFLVLTGLILEIAALLTLAFNTDPTVIAIAFIAHQSLPALLMFGLDIFFEGTLVTYRDAEKIRSYYLTFMSLAFVAAPLVVGFIAGNGTFQPVYIISAICVAILWFVIFDMFAFVKPKRYREIGFIDSLRKFLKRKHLNGIFFMNFLLQCFYALMIIFTGPYLHNVIGLSWASIGLIFTIMLLPFAIFEAPLGRLFEKFHDERDILMVGFFIMSASTLTMSVMNTQSVALWAVVLFMSRVGASFVEVSTEAAFFRRITDQDAGFIGVYRLAMPLSYLCAPFVASLIVPALPITALYIVLSVILLGGIVVAYELSF